MPPLFKKQNRKQPKHTLTGERIKCVRSQNELLHNHEDDQIIRYNYQHGYILETITQYDTVLIKFKIQQNSMIHYLGIHVHVVNSYLKNEEKGMIIRTVVILGGEARIGEKHALVIFCFLGWVVSSCVYHYTFKLTYTLHILLCIHRTTQLKKNKKKLPAWCLITQILLTSTMKYNQRREEEAPWRPGSRVLAARAWRNHYSHYLSFLTCKMKPMGAA